MGEQKEEVEVGSLDIEVKFVNVVCIIGMSLSIVLSQPRCFIISIAGR